jgi:hypothetical protein
VHGLVPSRPAGRDPVAEEERRLRAAVEEVTALDLEVEALSQALAEFGRRYEQAMGEAFSDLDAAQRLVRRLQALEDEAARLADLLRAGPPVRPPARRRRAPRPPRADPGTRRGAAASAPEAGAPEEASAPEVEPEQLVLKRLLRRLARLLHPDLARDDAERSRLGELMARVNAAYARGDRTALELMAEKVGAGEPLGELSGEERLAHLGRRLAAMQRLAASLRRERARLEATDTHRLREEARRREAVDRDLVAEARAEVEEEARHAVADALARLGRLAGAAQDLERSRRTAMSQLSRGRGPTGALRAFDPLSESALVRRGVQHLDRQRATREARELARRLEEAADSAPWEVALTLMAFFAEAAGRPPRSLSTGEGWAERYERLRAAWPAAPSFERLLLRLPPHLEVGMRATPRAVAAGLQLAALDLLAGVRISLHRSAVTRLGREVLRELGPRERCGRCRRTETAVHLLRTRGLDELHGLLCPRCGAVLRSYWRYGEVEGLEALAPWALQLGSVREQVVHLADAAIGFQFLPADRERLRSGGLRRLFCEIYLSQYGLAVPPSEVALRVGRVALAPGEAVPEGQPVRIALGPRAGLGEAAALELLRDRIERRFRPGIREGGEEPPR